MRLRPTLLALLVVSLLLSVSVTAAAQDAPPNPNTDPDAYGAWKLSLADPAAASKSGSAPASAMPAAAAASMTGLLVPYPGTGGWSSLAKNDDGSDGPIALGFSFDFYGTTYTDVFVNNNGNISFGSSYDTFTSTGFPSSDFVMIAPFWADVDTRCAGCGLTYYKVDGSRFIAHFEGVGYYNNQDDKLNTFQVVISDGTDPLLGTGNNVCFGYADMQWTTGDVTGSEGFGGTAATVGANKGDGTNYFQIGRFDQAGSTYDGPDGANDGVDYLDGQSLCYSTNTASNNIAPIPSGFPTDNLYEVEVGNTLNGSVFFSAPESGQTNTVTVTDGGLANFSSSIGAPANTVNVTFSFTPDGTQVGDHLVTFEAVDDAPAPLTTTRVATLRVTNPAADPCTDPQTEPSFDGQVYDVDGQQAIRLLAPQGGTVYEFYDTANLIVGDPMDDVGTPYADFSRVGDTFTWIGGGSPPTVVYFPLSPASASPTVRFFLRVTDECARTVDVDPVLETGGETTLPAAVHLEQNYPEPFNPQTTIRFTLPEATAVRLAVYDLTGREIARLVDGYREAGAHETTWNGRDVSGRAVPSGVYLYRLTTPAAVQTRRMTILK